MAIHRLRLFVGEALNQQNFDFAAAVLRPTTRRKDFGIVEHQKIAGIEKAAKLGKHAMNDFAGRRGE